MTKINYFIEGQMVIQDTNYIKKELDLDINISESSSCDDLDIITGYDVSSENSNKTIMNFISKKSLLETIYTLKYKNKLSLSDNEEQAEPENNDYIENIVNSILKEEEKRILKNNINLNSLIYQKEKKNNILKKDEIEKNDIVPFEYNCKRNVFEINLEASEHSIPVRKRKPVNLKNSTLFLCENDPQSKQEIFQMINKAIDNVKETHGNSKATPPKKFVFGSNFKMINIDFVSGIYEFKYGELYGLLQKHNTNNKYTENYVKLIGSKIICFKSNPIEDDNIVYLNHTTFQNPICPQKNYISEFIINTNDFKLYLNSEISGLCAKLFCCRKVNVDKLYLIEISDGIVERINKEGKLYKVNIKQGDYVKTIAIQKLEFVLESKGKLYSFICNNEQNFTNWLMALQLRHGRELCTFA
ncbi:hypothetical protein NUSPORA_00012 [Nucleospora cyclopteri]